MRSPMRSSLFVTLLMNSLFLGACSHALSSTGGSGGGPFTISVTVSGLAGSGLVLLDNTTDKLTITANGTFPFAATIAKGGSYAVTVQTQPSNPTQTCASSASSGSNIHANVTVPASSPPNPLTPTTSAP